MNDVFDLRGLGERSVTVLQGLRHDVMEGVFPVGSVIPNQDALAERFHCTRPTVQRAVARLVAEGWLATKPGSGTFVLRSSEPETRPSTAIAVMFTEDSHDLSNLQHAIIGAGHLLSIYQQTPHGWNPAMERQFLETVLHNRCRGLIAFCTPVQPLNEDLLEQLAASGVRVVHVEPYSLELPGQDFALPDYACAGQMAATAFLVGGYRHIVFAPMANSPFEQLIEAGFSRVLRDHGRPYDAATHRLRIPDPQYTPNFLPELIKTIRQLPSSTAILVRSAANANLLRDVIEQAGRAVPDDLGLLGIQCDCNPPEEGVDILHLDRRAMLQKAVDHIIGGGGRRLRVLVPPVLVRRGTVRGAKGAA